MRPPITSMAEAGGPVRGGHHLDAELLQLLALGIALDDDVARAQAHLEQCPGCASELKALVQDVAVVRSEIVGYARALRPSRRRDWAEISGRVVPPAGGWRRLVFRLAAGGIGGVALTVLLTVGLTAAAVGVVSIPRVRSLWRASLPTEPAPTPTPTTTPTGRARAREARPDSTALPVAVPGVQHAAEPAPTKGRRQAEQASPGGVPLATPLPLLAVATSMPPKTAAPDVILTPTPKGPPPVVGGGTMESDRPTVPWYRGTPGPPPGGSPGGPEPPRDPRDPREPGPGPGPDPGPRGTPGAPPPPPGGGREHPGDPGPGDPRPRGARPSPTPSPPASITPLGISGGTPSPAPRGGLGGGTAVVP